MKCESAASSPGSEGSNSASNVRASATPHGNATATPTPERFSSATGRPRSATTTSGASRGELVHDTSNAATSSSAARRAKTSAAPAGVPEWASVPVPACGGSSSESSELSALRSCFLRTLLALAGGGSLRSRRRWPRSGTGGLTFASELATSGITTNATACSSLLPTLTATAYGGLCRRGRRTHWACTSIAADDGAPGRRPPLPPMVRAVYGLPHRVDRMRCLGNACIPEQAAEAWSRLVRFHPNF